MNIVYSFIFILLFILTTHLPLILYLSRKLNLGYLKFLQILTFSTLLSFLIIPFVFSIVLDTIYPIPSPPTGIIDTDDGPVILTFTIGLLPHLNRGIISLSLGPVLFFMFLALLQVIVLKKLKKEKLERKAVLIIILFELILSILATGLLFFMTDYI